MRRWIAVAALAACGESAPTEEELAVGTWAYEGADGCTYGLTLERDGEAAVERVCTLDDGSMGIEARVGRYTFDGVHLTMRTTESTCPESVPPQTFDATVTETQLRLTDRDGSEVFERVEGGAQGGGAARFGCFDAADAFEPRPLSRV